MSIFDEMPGSPTEHWTSDGATAVRKVLCTWDDRYIVAQMLMATNYPYASLYFPEVVPDAVQIDPLGTCKVNEDGNTYYTKAVLTANYSYKASDTALNGKWSRSDSIRVEHITLEREQLVWHHDAAVDATGINEPLHKSMVRIEKTTDTTLTRRDCNNIPRSTFLSLEGQLNNATFLGHPAYYVLFNGGEGSQTQGLPGQCTLKFSIKNHDWRKGWREASSDHYQFVHPANDLSGYVYTAADLDTLLQDTTYA